MNAEKVKDLAHYLADKVISNFPNQNFDYDYLVANFIQSIENSKKQNKNETRNI